MATRAPMQGTGSDPICVVGLGAYTAVGLSTAATAAAVRAGVSGFEEHPYMINQDGDPYVLAAVPAVDPYVSGCERFKALALPAAEEALKPLRELAIDPVEVGVTIGLPEQRPGLPEGLAESLDDQIRSLSNEHYLIKTVRTAYRGHAAGLMAIQSAAKMLAQDDCQFCLVGGIDSYLDPDTLDWIEDNDQLHTPSNAWGFVPGEASGFCLLCRRATATRLGLGCYATLLSVASAVEANRIKTETVCIGEGLTQAVRDAVDALPSGAKIAQTYCDQNGEAYRADEFGFMLARLSERFADPSDYVAPADCWGDVGAASGPLFVNLAASAAQKGYAKGERSLLWTSSEGGDRTAVLLAAEIADRERQ